MGKPSKRKAGLSGVALLLVLLLPALSGAAPGGSGTANHDFATGSGSNQFLVVLGEARLSVAAQSDSAGGSPSGHIRAQGDPDGAGPAEPFQLEGPVTCVRVSGNRVAIKYPFKHATGSAEPFAGGGVQIFLEDNGGPVNGQAVDRSTFDPPQPAGVFDLGASQCDDPNTRLGYDQIESGDFVIHDATP
jgi:hypothetical protein